MDSQHRDGPDKLDFGAVAFLDVLGFKGMWDRYGHVPVLRKLRSLTLGTGVHSDPPFPLPEFTLGETRVISLSDSLILSTTVSASPGQPNERQSLWCKVAALTSVCAKAATMYAMGAGDMPPFVYRGAVAVGEFFHDDRFAIGPAIDEAAEHERLADAGMVWLSTSAHEVAREARFAPDAHEVVSFADLEPFIVLDYPVPMKQSEGEKPADRRYAPVVNPFTHVLDVYEEAFLERVDASFASADPARVETKRRNTLEFLRVARALEPKRMFRRGRR